MSSTESPLSWWVGKMPRNGLIARSTLRSTHWTNPASGLAPPRRRKNASSNMIAVTSTTAHTIHTTTRPMRSSVGTGDCSASSARCSDAWAIDSVVGTLTGAP